MFHTYMALVPALTGSPGGSRFRRGGRSRAERPAQEGHGKWIWIADPNPIPNSYLQARKAFSLPAKPTSAIIKACADSRYKLFVNGHYVGKGPVRGGEGYCYFDTHDVTELLNKGDNVIAVLAHHIGERTHSSTLGKPGLICKVEIEVDGETQLLGTDETWKVRRATEWSPSGARLSQDLGFQEIYEAENAPDGWTEIKFAEKGWEDATGVGVPPAMPWGDLRAREIAPLREEKVLPRAIVAQGNTAELNRETPATSMPDIMAATELAPLKSGSVTEAGALLYEEGVTHIKTPRGDKGVAVILDFGREVFGNIELAIAPTGTGCIDIGYSEVLTDGRVKPNLEDAKYTDRIVLKKGRLDWQSFEPRAFRFMQIEFRRCSRPIVLEHVRVNQATYPVDRAGDFECDDRVINDIWRAGVYTTQLCMEDTFIDSPRRERAQWWGDARVLSRAAYYAFDDTKLLAQGLRMIASSQDRDGSILGLYPASEEMLVPDYALLWVFSILDYFAFSDDPDLVRDLYPTVQKLLKWFAKSENDCGLLENVPGGLLIDRADLQRKGEVTSLNCLYYQALRVASALASISGKPEEAQDYVDAANRVKAAINKYVYVPKRGLYAECRIDGVLVEKFSRQTNTLAALFDVAGQYQKLGIFRQIGNGGLPELATPYFASFYLEALYSADHHEQALDYMRRKWGAMVRDGATTLWEDFSSEGSVCHGSAVAPARDLIAEFVGIKPVPGTHRFSVTPHPGDLKWARGSVNTKSGRLTVDWRILRNRLDIAVEVPDGLKVDVYPPGPVDSTITVDGKDWPSRFVTLSAGKHIIRVTQPKQQKIAAYDELPMPSLFPHVEVLDRGIRIGRRGVEIEPRRRGGRRERPEGPIEVRMDDVTVGEELDVNMEREEVQPGAETREAAADGKRRRRTRGGRGRKPSTAEAPAAEAAPREAPEAAVEPAEPVEAAHAEPTEEAARKRRRRRGGRGRSRSGLSEAAPVAESPEHAAEQPTEEPLAELVAAPEATEQAAEGAPTHKRRRRSRGGRGRGRSGAAESVSTEETPAQPAEETVPQEQPEPQATEEAAEGAPAHKRRRRSRGGRGRGRSATTEQVGTEEAHAEAPAPEPVIEIAPAAEAAPVDSSEPAPKKTPRPRSRGGTRKKPNAAESAPAEASREEASAPRHEPEPTPPAAESVQAESSDAPPKKKRTYTRRKPRASEPEPPAEAG